MKSNGANENVRDHDRYQADFDELPFERILETFRKRRLLEIIASQSFSKNPRILEIGPGYNPISNDFFPNSYKVILEPSPELFKLATIAFEDNELIQLFNLDLESYASLHEGKNFDLIILSSVLHEFQNPQRELEFLFNLLNRDGKLLVVVPNNLSVHRQFGVTLGILENTNAQTETEKLMQQNTNFSPESLTNKLQSVNFQVEFLTTSFVKPHTHLQMQIWRDAGLLDDDMLENLYSMSRIFHPFNSEIFAIAKKL